LTHVLFGKPASTFPGHALSAGRDPEHIRELFAAFGPVTVRRMFGGAGVFAEGMMLALIADGVIYLKADEQTVPAFEREGLRPFTYMRRGAEAAVMSYWRMPERLYDDPEELATWARAALETARRAAVRTRPKAKTKAKGSS
jgi:DNA transformation protein and related proteins